MKTKKIKLWHATNFENCLSITEHGIRRGCDNVVYACKRPEEAARFVAIRGIKHILCVAFEVDEKDVHESFDHSKAFFKCNAYYVDKDIQPKDIISLTILSVGQ